MKMSNREYVAQVDDFQRRIKSAQKAHAATRPLYDRLRALTTQKLVEELAG